jgi:hypothetical protein
MSEHAAHAKLILEQVDDLWHVGDPHDRLLLAQTHALLALTEAVRAIASSVTPLPCPSRGSDGSRCIRGPQGHDGCHWNGVAGWIGQ